MKYKTESSEKSTVKITMTFDKNEWEAANQKAYEQTRGKYFVNGFRKGKAPRHVIELNYGKGVFYEDALNNLFSDHYYDIVEKEKDNFTVVGQPQLSVEDISENGAVLVDMRADYEKYDPADITIEDGLHLNPKGHGILIRKVFPEMAKLLK